jgi:hypothetical protein
VQIWGGHGGPDTPDGGNGGKSGEFFLSVCDVSSPDSSGTESETGTGTRRPPRQPAAYRPDLGITDGCYINYPDIDLSDEDLNTSDQPWHQLYYKNNYARLQRTKQHWDPRNVFRHGQSIEPPETN